MAGLSHRTLAPPPLPKRKTRRLVAAGEHLFRRKIRDITSVFKFRALLFKIFFAAFSEEEQA